MKRCVEMIMLFVLVLSCVSFGADKVVAPKAEKPAVAVADWRTETLTPEKAKLYEDWRTVCADADKACEAKEYDKASELYLQYSKIGEQLGRADLKAWGLNNAGYMLIKKHARDKWDAKELFSEDYAKAKLLLNSCLKVEGVDPKTVECAKQTLIHIDTRLGVK